MIGTIPILSSDKVILRPFNPMNEIDLITRLANQYKYNKTPDFLIKWAIGTTGLYFWKGYTKEGQFGGIVYLSHFKEIDRYTLDAYRDFSVKLDRHYFKEAGRLVIDFALKEITNVLYTAHDVRNRLATKMCKDLGFNTNEVMNTAYGQFIWMKRRR